MKFFLSISLFFICLNGIGQTIIKDGSTIFGQWNSQGSPYIIEGKATVPVGETLHIGPSVKIKLKSLSTSNSDDFKYETNKSGHIIVKGTLIAQGNKNELISFDRLDEGKWGSIYFDSTSAKNALKYCIIRNSYGIVGLRKNVASSGAINTYKSSLKIENCVISTNWRGIETAKSKLKILNTTLINNEETGIMISDTNEVDLFNSIIWGSHYTFYYSFNKGQKNIIYNLSIQNSALEKNEYDVKGKNIYSRTPDFQEKSHYEIRDKSFYADKATDNNKIGFR